MLKIVTPILFAVGTYYFYQARQAYGGEIQRIVNLLFAGGIAAFLSMSFRYLGDSAFSWKWGESTFMLIFALTNLYVALLVNNRLRANVKAPEIIEEC